MTDQDWTNFLGEADVDGDGSISLNEFFDFLERHCLN